MSTISGTWPTIGAPDVRESPPAGSTPALMGHRIGAVMMAMVLWARGLTRRGKPPRDESAHRRKLARLLLIAVGYGLVGAGVMRLLLGGM